MARILIVGCGGRGTALARALAADGHAVRGTTRDPARLAAIEAAGAEAVLADPDRIATLMDALANVTVVAWLLRTAAAPELHAGRLRMLCEKLVDTHVRGLLYESAGAGGEAIVEHARVTWNLPVEVLRTDPADCAAWSEEAKAAVDRLLGGR